jgi:hypothetical protein
MYSSKAGFSTILWRKTALQPKEGLSVVEIKFLDSNRLEIIENYVLSF